MHRKSLTFSVILVLLVGQLSVFLPLTYAATRYKLGDYWVSGTEILGDITGTRNYTESQHMTFYFYNDTTILRMQDFKPNFSKVSASVLQVFGDNDQASLAIMFSLNFSLPRPLVISMNFTPKVDFGISYFRFYMANTTNSFAYSTSVKRTIREGEDGTWENGFVLRLNITKGKFHSFLLYNDGFYDILEYQDPPLEETNSSISLSDPVETRYFRSDTEVVDGVTYRKLLTSQTLTQGTIASRRFVKFQVYVYYANATTALLGTTSAIDTGSTDGMYNVAWDCPLTSLLSTDRILVKVTASSTSGGTYSVIGSFITEQLGAASLDAATWTFYYYGHYYETVRMVHAPDCEYSEVTTPHWEFYFDTATYNSCITNFTWTATTGKSWHSVATWSFELLTRQWNEVARWWFEFGGLGWHDVALWKLILQPITRSGLLLIAIVIGIILSFGFVRVLASKRRKTTQTSAEMLYSLSYRIRKKGIGLFMEKSQAKGIESPFTDRLLNPNPDDAWKNPKQRELKGVTESFPEIRHKMMHGKIPSRGN